MNISISIGISDGDQGTGGGVSTDFITKWETTGINEIVIFPFSGTNNFTVDWGDGNSETVTTANPQHTYVDIGIYTVTCSGSATAYGSTNAFRQAKIKEVVNWGSMNITDFSEGFQSSINVVITATDALTGVTDMQNMFRSASLANPSMNNWDTSGVTNMNSMFKFATVANPDVSSLDVSSVTDMTDMFSNSSFSDANYDLLLAAWSLQTLQSAVPFHAGTAQYTETAARTILTDAPNSWTITDGGAA